MSEKQRDHINTYTSDEVNARNDRIENQIDFSRDTNVNNSATVTSSNESPDVQDKWMATGDSWMPPSGNYYLKSSRIMSIMQYGVFPFAQVECQIL